MRAGQKYRTTSGFSGFVRIWTIYFPNDSSPMNQLSFFGAYPRVIHNRLAGLIFPIRGRDYPPRASGKNEPS
jgi:hypothetical protein